jgi:transposase InsO family protein
MPCQFMQQNRGRHSIRETAATFGVSGSACYKRARKGASSRREEEDAGLLSMIREIAERHRRRYGILRVREALRRDHGKRASRKKAARLLRENGLNARRKRKFIPTASSSRGLPACANLPDRQLHAEQGGQKRVSDITYLRASGGRLYLTVVLDLVLTGRPPAGP